MIDVCQHCKAEFQHKYRSRRLYCSKECLCAQRDSLKTVKSCTLCKEPFFGRKSKIETFCSNECKNSVEGRKILNAAIEDTVFKRYGVKNAFQSEEKKALGRRTMMEKYGVENSGQSRELQEQRRQSINNKYGVDNVMRDPAVALRVRRTYKEKHSFPNIASSLSKKHIVPQFDLEYFLNHEEYPYKCLVCDEAFVSRHSNNQHVFCPSSLCMTRSTGEYSVAEFIKSIDDSAIFNKKFYEHGKLLANVDVFLPVSKLAVEYHGLYWHSEAIKHRLYHHKRVDIINGVGAEIIQVWDYEWHNTGDIVRGIIKNRLGLCNRLYARKCVVREVGQGLYRDFCNSNHIQGYVSAKTIVGLFYNNELIQIASFRDCGQHYELSRLCTKVGFNVIGGFSKLLRSFMGNTANKKPIVSYVNSRYFTGKSYEKCGFGLTGRTQPGYFYSNGNSVLSRYQCQKKKLSKILKKFDSGLSEHQNMLNNHYYRVYDAGNYKYTLNWDDARPW